MSWAEVKHAINSTVGTSEFKSLDKMITDNWTLAISTDEYILESVDYTNVSAGNYTINNSYKMKADGSAKVRLRASWQANTKYRFQAYRNGTSHSSILIEGNGSSNTTVLSLNLHFKRDDVFTFELVRDTGSAPISTMTDIALLCTPMYAPILVESL